MWVQLICRGSFGDSSPPSPRTEHSRAWWTDRTFDAQMAGLFQFSRGRAVLGTWPPNRRSPILAVKEKGPDWNGLIPFPFIHSRRIIKYTTFYAAAAVVAAAAAAAVVAPAAVVFFFLMVLTHFLVFGLYLAGALHFLTALASVSTAKQHISSTSVTMQRPTREIFIAQRVQVV